MEIKANTADQLFDAVLLQFAKSGEKTDLKNVKYELINANLILTNPTANTMCDGARGMSLKYAIAELLWYNSTNPSVKSIEPYSKFWKNISDDGKTVNSNYGYCIRKKFGFDQWEMCKQLLSNDSLSRQAVMHIKEARDIVKNPTKDLNCTIALQFFVRNNKLDLIVTMRSNDVWLGLPYDLFNFTCMQMQMAMELGIEVGTYYHNAGSLHMYERDFNKLKEVYDESRAI
jgi:thymidylate synthase